MAEFGGRGAGTEAVLGVRTETTVDPRRTEIFPRAPARVSSHDHESQGVGPFFASGFNSCFSDADFVALLRTAVETVQKKKYTTELLRGTGRVPRNSLTMAIVVLTVADSLSSVFTGRCARTSRYSCHPTPLFPIAIT